MSASSLMAVVDKALELSSADETEVILQAMTSGVTRFAESAIHQNVYEENAVLMVRVVVGNRVAGLRTNRLAPSELQRAISEAMTIAKASPPDPSFPGLPDPQPIPPDGRFIETTAQATPMDRAARVRTFVEATSGLRAAGALETEAHDIVVGNSRGLRAAGRFTQATFVAVVDGGDATGYVEAYNADLTAFSMEVLGARVTAKVRTGRSPQALPPGQYPVILEAPAVALMTTYLGLMAFNGKAVYEGRSFLASRLGQQVVDPRLSIWDDATDPRTPGVPFDFEGVPKRKVFLVERGIARTAVYDRRTARLARTETTGHALPQPNAYGPVPTNLFLSTGETSVEDMIASTERGLLITRFHYVRVVDPMRTIITGMTRDGTFLIEGGRIVGGVKNLRFNQSILEAFANLEAIGAEGTLSAETYLGAAWVPALKVGGFNFTSATTF